jgi:molybdopterin-containing oxidoreductase family iron-sulfur binding subunit
MASFTIDRRNFLKSLGIVGGTAVVGCNRMAPEESLVAYLTPPAELVPGVAAHYATVCRACPAGCGVLARTREGRPVKLEGNPAHPINRGALCARGQAFIQGLYGRHRLRRPRVRHGGELVAADWTSAMDRAAAALSRARKTVVLTGLESGAFDDLLEDLGPRLRSPLIHLVHEPAVPTSMATAAGMLFGRRELPRIDLSRVEHVVSLGADFLDAWISPVELSRQWAARHGMAADRALTMDYAGPRRNLTAVAADRWHRLSADGIERLALTLLHRVFDKQQARLGARDRAAAVGVLRRLGPPPEDPGVSPEVLEQLFQRLMRADRGLVLFGGSDVTGERATAVHVAVLLTNHMLGSVGEAVRFGDESALGRVDGEALVLEAIESAASGVIDALVLYGTDPVYSLPGVADALARVENVIALDWEERETTAAAHVVLPVHHPLESWGDYQVSRSIAGLMQPVRAPLHDTRHAGDLLIELAQRTGAHPAHLSFRDYLVARWVGPPALDPAAWQEMLVAGGRYDSADRAAVRQLMPSRVSELPRLGSTTDEVPPKPVDDRPPSLPAGASEGSPMSNVELIVPVSNMLYDGRDAALDWLREVPCPLTQVAWDIPAELAEDVAAAAGVEDGDLIELESESGKVEVKAVVESGLAPGTVALRPGGGRDRLRHGEGTANPLALLPALTDALSGELARAGTRVALRRLSRDTVVSTMGSPRSEGRLLALSVPLGDLRAGELPVITRHGQLSAEEAAGSEAHAVPMPHQEQGGTRPADNMYSLQEHAEHRWGMVVDLDLCTGCSACAVACYAENNIPVVGRDEVALGRELSWIRIEPHLFGAGDRERVQWLPVMCQQCDNAPCESVCPVFASSHTTDGLNAQIYNRCIGTRYCANNCPYKVRRFNYFDYERELPANQQLNPDVTVRSRGVMEKCDIVPACVQTCPTGALSFGDFNREDWKMSRLARGPRGYRLLDYMVNTRPGVVYLRKVLTDDEGEG